MKMAAQISPGMDEAGMARAKVKKGNPTLLSVIQEDQLDDGWSPEGQKPWLCT